MDATGYYDRINLRGKVIPVIELRAKFGMESQDDTEKTCIIVVQVVWQGGGCTMGVIIDEVREVLDIDSAHIEPPPTFGSTVDSQFIMGIGKVNDQVKILLDIDKVLTPQEMQGLASLS